MRGRVVLRALAAGLLLWLGGLADAAAQTPTLEDPPTSTSAVDPGAVVKWDPESGWNPAPPFDVQFFIELEVDDKVESLSGRYVGDTEPQYCDRAFPRIRRYVDYGYGPRDLLQSERRQVLPMEGWQRDPKRPQKTARLDVVQGLLPNRHYCFEIIKVRKPDTDSKEFQERLAGEIERALRKRDAEITESSIRREAYEDLREAAIDAIESGLAANERLIIPSGSFLDGTAETLVLPATEKRRFDDVLEVQSSRDDQFRNFRDNAKGIAGTLDELFGLEALGDAREGLDSGSLKEQLAWVDLTLTPAVLLEVSEGTLDLRGALADQRGDNEAAITRAKPWAEIWTAQELAVRTDNFNKTLTSLATLADVAKGDGNGNGDPSPLESAIGAVRGAIRFVLEEDFEELKELLERRGRAALALVEHITRTEIERMLIEGSTTADYETQFNWYLGLDLGFAWARDVEDLFSYFGTSIYFRPVNKKAPLSWSGFRHGRWRSELLKRLSITVGVTVDDLEARSEIPAGQFQSPTEDSLIEGVIGDSQLVVGGGFRLNRYARLTAGVLVFKDANPDPLIDRSSLTWSPLVSVSVDFDVRSSLEKRFKQKK